MCICVSCSAYTPFLYPHNEHIPIQQNHSSGGVWEKFLRYKDISQYYRQKEYDTLYNKKQDNPILQWYKEHQLRDVSLFLPPNLHKNK